MNDLDRLKEMAGIKEGLVQEKRFGSSEQMLSHIVGELHRIVRDATRDPDQQWDDLMWELDNLIEMIDDSDVR